MENKPILIDQFADNGEFSHWHLIDQKTGSVLWSSFPEETIAKGQKIVSFDDVLKERTIVELAENVK